MSKLPVNKGQLILVKAPPYYEKEYVYEIISAGDKQIRATLHHSPKVKKSWTLQEFLLHMKMGLVRVDGVDEVVSANKEKASSAVEDEAASVHEENAASTDEENAASTAEAEDASAVEDKDKF